MAYPVAYEVYFMDKLTMSVNEVLEDMRKNGIAMSPKKFNFLVDSGELPFAKVMSTGATGRRAFVIMRQGYKSWLKSVLEG